MRVEWMVPEDWRSGGAVDGSSEVGWEGMGGVSGRGFRSATASRAGGSISRRDVDRSDGGSLWSDFSIPAPAVVLSSSLVVVREKTRSELGMATASKLLVVHLQKGNSEVVLKRKRSDGVG